MIVLGGLCRIRDFNVWYFLKSVLAAIGQWQPSAKLRVSNPRESHPKALAEPDVNLSTHTAPIIQPGTRHQIANAQRARVGI